jgi:hypothetical protein
MPEQFFALRGSRSLSKEEFEAHLALAIRLENVAVLLGAGASKCVGGQTMADIWASIQAGHAADTAWLRDNHFLPDGAEEPNIELLLDQIEIACRDAQRRQAEAEVTRLVQVRHVLRKAVVRAAILEEELWLRPDKSIIHERFGHHIRFLARLVGNRQPGQAAPWVFTTNYDLAIEWAAEALGVHCVNGFTGLHNRAFRPSSFDLGLRNVQARGEARFGTYNVYVAKLHGSISWAVEDDGSVLEQPSRTIKPKIDAFLASGEPSEWPGFLIFPGAAKFVQTTGFVYGEIIRRFTEFLSKPNACLVISGYGFADDHINRLIVSALQNPTLQVIIYLPEIDRLGIYPTLAASGPAMIPNEQLRRLLLAQLPQITVRGFGDGAYFDSLAADLPEPALIDDTSERARSIEQLLRRVTNVPVSAGGVPPAVAPQPAADTAENADAAPDQRAAE